MVRPSRGTVAAATALCLLLVVGVAATPAHAVDPPRFNPACPQQIPRPTGPAEWSIWLAGLRQWRDQERAATGYNPANYARPELGWAQRNPIQPQVMVEDRFLYDPVTRRHTVDRYLADGQACALTRAAYDAGWRATSPRYGLGPDGILFDPSS